MNFVDNLEIWLRGGIFLGLLCLFMTLEHFWPRKARVMTRITRWGTNLGMTIVNTVAIRLMEPVTAILAAGYAAQKGWGLFNLIELPQWAELLLAVILLDLAIYAQHVITHKVPLLWRLHKVHHVDRDIDTSTALRFHPLEIALSMLYKVGLVFLLGPAAIAILIFEAVLNGSAMFNHSNLSLPKSVDRVLRLVIVTPDMHRVHHSVYPDETNSNYGFSLSLWDRLFGTYISQPKAGHINMTIGLSEYQTKSPAKLVWSLLLPFKRKDF